MKKLIMFFLFFFIVIKPLLPQNATEAQGRVTQIAVPVMSVNNERLVKLLMDEFFIPETLVTRMEIIDVGKNGFGAKDLVRVYPSDEIYFVEYVSQKAQQIMNDWEFKANFQIIAQNTDPDVLNNQKENKPAYNIFISLLRSLGRNYKDYPMKIKLERDSSTVTFEMWDYNEGELKFDPKPDTYLSDHLTKQAFSIVDSTYYDCIFIYKTLIDTVYIYRPGMKTVQK